MNTQQIIFDTITFKESLDKALDLMYQGHHYIRVDDIFGQEVTIYNRENQTMVMSDKKDVIWEANNSKGSQARLIEWLMSNEDTKK